MPSNLLTNHYASSDARKICMLSLSKSAPSVSVQYSSFSIVIIHICSHGVSFNERCTVSKRHAASRCAEKRLISKRCYNAAVSAMAGSAKWQEALALLGEMRQEGLSPDQHTYSAASESTWISI